VVRESFVLHFIPQLTLRHSIKHLLVVYMHYVLRQVELPSFFNKLLNYKYSNRFYGVLTMVYNTQNYWVVGLCP
jgi:hypothetical protein